MLLFERAGLRRSGTRFGRAGRAVIAVPQLSEIAEDLTEKVGTMSLYPAPAFTVKEEVEELRGGKARALVEPPSQSNPLDTPNFADVFDKTQAGVEMFRSDDGMMGGVWEKLIELDSPIGSCSTPLGAQQVNVAVPAPSQNLSSLTVTTVVLTARTPDLQTRFDDKLVKAMGAQLAAALTSQVNHVASDIKDSGLMLPSGGNAPEIALPLASAVLGACVMSSLQSLGLGGGGQQVAAEKIATISA